jgi:ABC-type antimicrobial peptide transport system permease subunit
VFFGLSATIWDASSRIRTSRHYWTAALDTRLARHVPGGVNDIHSLDQNRALSLYPFRAASLIGLAVGGTALLLTLSGVYGTVSYLVTQRTKEIGIRVALGATTRIVTVLVLNQSFRVAVAGVSLGAAIAIALSRLLASRIVFLRVFDAQVFAASVLLVLGAALAAGYIPARRATRVDPMKTLRSD